jgi:hypothetical protein
LQSPDQALRRNLIVSTDVCHPDSDSMRYAMPYSRTDLEAAIEPRRAAIYSTRVKRLRDASARALLVTMLGLVVGWVCARLGVWLFN